jgi:hypothetical protein
MDVMGHSRAVPDALVQYMQTLLIMRLLLCEVRRGPMIAEDGRGKGRRAVEQVTQRFRFRFVPRCLCEGTRLQGHHFKR